MKKIIGLVVMLLLCILPILLLGGCGEDPSHTSENGEPDTPSSGNTEPSQDSKEGENSGTSSGETEAKVPAFGRYKHVVILGVDGAGAFFESANTPCMDRIFADGATSYAVKTSYPTISGQCWGSMLHGVLPEFHRITNDIASSTHYDPQSPYPSIFRVLREADDKAVMASFSHWNPINFGIIEEGIGVTKGTGDDASVYSQILRYLEDKTPSLLFVQFDSVDGAGHSYGYGTEKYLSAITVVDSYIGGVYNKLKSQNLLDDTLFIVTADHGGSQKSHGGDTRAERYVFMGVTGKGVRKSEITDAEVRDIPAIAAYALGLEAPETWTGRLPTGIFPGVGGGEHVEAELPISEARKHANIDTPDAGELKEALGTHSVLAYLPFDGNVSPALCDATATANGKLYYSKGYFGDGVSLDDGYVTLNGVSLGKDSFTIAFWIKTNGVPGDPAIISNKDWKNGANDGFVLSLRSNDIKFNVGNASLNARLDPIVPLPPDYKEGWMHVLVSVDRVKNEITFYQDFEKVLSSAITENLQNYSYDALSLNVGQDGTGEYSQHLAAQLDELIVASGAFDAAAVETLHEHYSR